MILDKFGYLDYSIAYAPYDPSVQLIKNNDNFVNQEKHAQIIGSFLFLANRTKSDIAYIILKLSSYTGILSMSHWII